MGGGGGTRVTYKSPEPDRSFEKYLEYQMQQDKIRQKRLDEEKAAEKQRLDSRRARATTNLATYYSNLSNQLESGLLSFADASSQLENYAGRYDLEPGTIDAYSNELTEAYTNDIRPGRQKTGVEYAYSEILGRQATDEEKQRAAEGFQQGYFATVDDFKDSLYKTDEYQDTRNQSYLDNYYDTQYGKQLKDEDGKLTGQRTFKFNENYMPVFQGDLEGKSGVKLPDFDDFTGSIAELEENTQSMRDARQYLYSAGLTNLQGDIDKELQGIKNQGAKDVAKISKTGDIYQSIFGMFNFNA